VVEVLVGVDHRHHLTGQGPHPFGDLLGRPLRGVGVDDDQSGLAADDADVDVEPGVPGHPAAVGDLDEPGIVAVVRSPAHGHHATASR
jgi:hypothetical protein